ncbi:hypothetical protein X975_17162, partial [Stegodyphus mimosarum]
MSMSCPSLCPVCGLFLVLLTFLLQLVALTTKWWATFSARVDLGKPKEDGHYGLWTICSTKGPHWTEDCDPLDTFFQVPSYMQVSGILGIIHLLMLLTLLPLISLRAIQIVRNEPSLGVKPRTLCIVKVSVAFLSVIIAILVAIFATVGENLQSEYSVTKGWSFWIQISVIGADILVTMVCVIENFRFWQQHIQQHIDPEGKRAETYGNPTFDADSPEPTRRRHSSNGVISYTESSGYPYNPNIAANDSPHKSHGSAKKSGNKVEKTAFHSKKKENNSRTLTYENESYQEHSPSARRYHRKYNQ